MSLAMESVEINAPIDKVYEQCLRFEDLPHYVEPLKRVERLSDTHARMVYDVAGRQFDVEAEIVEKLPERRITWRTTGEPRTTWATTFERLGDARTKVTFQVDQVSGGARGLVGQAVGGVQDGVAKEISDELLKVTKPSVREFKKHLEAQAS
ncbi:SRPBCC family protein [Kitasatospora brasiliensis]|uniref:SRPBCC family protein n=1 Tax=Kitasatospora brasiliensis TaxID=3058040 RepID=UPI00292D7BC0|nr:SRPBCC family protein [Kitasatospora sp. K002]